MNYKGLLYNAKIPKKLLKQVDWQVDKDKDTFDKLQRLGNRIEEFVEGGYNLYLYSKTTGNGKTTWAVNLLKYFISAESKKAKARDCLFIDTQTLLTMIKDFNNNKTTKLDIFKDKIRKSALVVWDDIMACNGSEYDKQVLFSFVNWRISEGLANIFTGNETKQECLKKLDSKITSRIFSGAVIEFKNQDMRNKASQKFFSEIL